MINSNCMYECEWCHADLGSNPKAYDEHVAECPAAIAAYKGRNEIIAKWQRGALSVEGLREKEKS